SAPTALRGPIKRRLNGLKGRGKPHYFGHRERLRQRFRDAEADAVPDYELLELILFRAAPQKSCWARCPALERPRSPRSNSCVRRDAADAWRGAGTSGAVLLGLLPSLDELRDQGAVPYRMLTQDYSKW